jgi:hypothetical protein
LYAALKERELKLIIGEYEFTLYVLFVKSNPPPIAALPLFAEATVIP